ncbi:hypothetical protein ABPG75_011999 [Micractinium tetrahymenae]
MPLAQDLQAAVAALLLAGQAWHLAATTTLDAACKLLRAGLALLFAPLRLGAATGQRVVGAYVPDVSRALSLDAALSAPPARLPSPVAPLHIDPTPFYDPPPHQAEQPQVQQQAKQPAASWADEGAQQEAGSAAASLPATPAAAPVGGGAEGTSTEASAGEGQHRRRLEAPAEREMEGAVGDEEDRIEAGYDRLGSVPPLSVAPSGTAEGLAAYMARQLSAAQREAEQEPLLTAPTSTAAAADITADEAAAAAAAGFAREAAEASQQRRPPSVENAEGADRLLGGEMSSSAATDATEEAQAAGQAPPPAVLEPSLPPMPAEEHLPPALPEPSLPPAVPEPVLPPMPAEPSLPPAAALSPSPSPVPAVSEAGAALPLPASPGELLRSRTGPLEEEGDEEAPLTVAALAAAAPAAATAPALPAVPRPSSAEQAGFTSGPLPLALDATAAAVSAYPAVAGWMPEGLAEPMDSPPPASQVLPLTSNGGSGSSSASGIGGLLPKALPALPLGSAAAGGGAGGNPFSPATPALAAPMPAAPVLGAGLDPGGALPAPPADRANTAFAAELAAAAHDLIRDG